MHHPWRALRDRPELEVFWMPMVGQRLAATDGAEVIVMRPGLLQVQRRCAIAHELAHVDLGHVHGASPAEEQAARLLAARRLIEMPDLLSALSWADDLPTVADELWVDEPTLMARLDDLTDDERMQITRLYAEVEGGC